MTESGQHCKNQQGSDLPGSKNQERAGQRSCYLKEYSCLVEGALYSSVLYELSPREDPPEDRPGPKTIHERTRMELKTTNAFHSHPKQNRREQANRWKGVQAGPGLTLSQCVLSRGNRGDRENQSQQWVISFDANSSTSAWTNLCHIRLTLRTRGLSETEEHPKGRYYPSPGCQV